MANSLSAFKGFVHRMIGVSLSTTKQLPLGYTSEELEGSGRFVTSCDIRTSTETVVDGQQASTIGYIHISGFAEALSLYSKLSILKQNVFLNAEVIRR